MVPPWTILAHFRHLLIDLHQAEATPTGTMIRRPFGKAIST